MTGLPSYAVYTNPFYEFDAVCGFRMTPHKCCDWLYVYEGKPVLNRRYIINPAGNMDMPRRSYESAQFKILVFGDSQTWMQLDQRTWPDFLEDELVQSLGAPVRAINYGRNGFGIVQQFDFARIKIEEHKPDLVIFAFISDDLTRDRMYFDQPILYGKQRVLELREPHPERGLKAGRDHAVVEPEATLNWSTEMIKSPNSEDPILKRMNARYFELKNEYIAENGGQEEAFRILDMPRLAINSYAEDPRFVDNNNFLRDSKTPFLLLHLPRYDELKCGAAMISLHGQRLLASLEELTGSKVFSLGSYYREHFCKECPDPFNLFMLPYDQHASMLGNRYYGKATASLVLKGLGRGG